MELDLVSRMLFPTPASSYAEDSFPGELIWIPKTAKDASSDDCIPCIFLGCKAARYLVIFVHANGEDIGRSYPFLLEMRDRFLVHVLAFEYPAYGICPGQKCDERGVTENALAAFHFAIEALRWPANRILIMGRSIGTGPAMTLAVKYAVMGLCLITPFLSVKQLFHDHAGFLGHLVQERFPNKELMPAVHCPCLVIHGEKDEIIPLRHGVELYEGIPGKKKLVLVPDMDHNADLFENYLDFAEPMLKFFSPQACGLEEVKVPKWAYERRLSETIKSPRPSPGPTSKPTRGDLFGLGDWASRRGLCSCSCSCSDQHLGTELDMPRPIRAESHHAEEELDRTIDMIGPDDGSAVVSVVPPKRTLNKEIGKAQQVLTV